MFEKEKHTFINMENYNFRKKNEVIEQKEIKTKKLFQQFKIFSIIFIYYCH